MERKCDYLVNNNSLYFVSGQSSSSTIISNASDGFPNFIKQWLHFVTIGFCLFLQLVVDFALSFAFNNSSTPNLIIETFSKI